MNEESILAWNIIEKTNANLFLTGKAGTGKTTFLKRLKELSPKRMIVLAPTGIAAINAGGMTIHFSPTIQVQGSAAEAVKGQVTEALNLTLRELEQLIARVSAQQARRAY